MTGCRMKQLKTKYENPSLSPHIEQDAFNLARFLEAQEDTYEQVVRELHSGQKRSHWMWFIFPQFIGLGSSTTSHLYALKSLSEVREYLHHPVLGQRLIECTKIVNHLQGRTARQVFSAPDDLKFHSSMTLFELAAGTKSEFTSALEKYFAGARDIKTIELIRSSNFE